MISARRSQIEPRAEAGNGAREDDAVGDGARHADAGDQPARHHRLLAAHPQCVGAGHPPPAGDPARRSPGCSEAVIATIAFVVALLVVSFLHVVIGEMVPKNLSFSMPDRAALVLAPAARLRRHACCSRSSGALNATANGVLRLFGVQPKERGDQRVHRRRGGEHRDAVDPGGRARPTASAPLNAAFEFSDQEGGATSPCGMPDLVSLRESATPADVERAVAQHGFSRYVLLDDCRRADRLPAPEGRASTSKRPASFDRAGARQAHPSAHLDLPGSRSRGRAGRDASVGVASGPGVRRGRDQTTGVLFLEDIIEELVGEVQDATRPSLLEERRARRPAARRNGKGAEEVTQSGDGDEEVACRAEGRRAVHVLLLVVDEDHFRPGRSPVPRRPRRKSPGTACASPVPR